MFKNILFPIDQSREAREAANMVTQLVNTFNSELHILSVVETTSNEEPPASGDSSMTSEKEVNELLQNAKDMFSQVGIEAKIIEREGKPAFVICDVADEIEADLIVMGSRGGGIVEPETSESVSTRVISFSPCPVLVIP
ncbi:universal stress protein [Geitlerinema sp. PCC 9228]|jgi:nucleotide-binding universal stress UspA family protein|uniref:universal stress protein n=1 Tax=Geitlerinema sp. PCC 9228 TaxID=111611 RepID=UPI0008F9945E|nr:universal stress protein [Geitlerinema sp. PCC 9228]